MQRRVKPQTPDPPVGAPEAAPPLETFGLADEIAFRLQAAIVAQKVRPGEWLRQEDLCQRVAVSRTPVCVSQAAGARVRIRAQAKVAAIYDLLPNWRALQQNAPAVGRRRKPIASLWPRWARSGANGAPDPPPRLPRMSR
jgi:hypothetical protein